MKRIYKYPLEVTDSQYVEMPIGAQVLSVMWQHDRLVAYALVDPDIVATQRKYFEIFGTGNPVPDNVHELFWYIGTVMDHIGMVWHVFGHKGN